MRVGHHQESQHKARAMQRRGGCRREQRTESFDQQVVNGPFAGPSEAESRQCHAHLRHREQPLRLRQQVQRGLCAYISLIGQLAQFRLPGGQQANFRGREKSVRPEDDEKKVDSDREARALRMRHFAEEAARGMPTGDRAAMAAYTRGVNAFIETHRDKLPVEFTMLGYQPRPCTVADCALIGFQMFRTLTTSWRDDLLKRNMLNSGDAAKVSFLFPPRTGREAQPGSNAWAIAGRLTASGKP